MATTVPHITPLPDMPNRLSGAAEFAQKADAALGALPTMVTEVNFSLSFVNDKVQEVATSAQQAAGYAQSAGDHAATAQSYAAQATQAFVNTQALAAALGNDAGLPAMDGNAGKPLIVSPDEGMVMFDNLPIEGGGTGADNAVDARANLGIGTNALGNRTISTSQPTGGQHGDIWYVIE